MPHLFLPIQGWSPIRPYGPPQGLQQWRFPLFYKLHEPKGFWAGEWLSIALTLQTVCCHFSTISTHKNTFNLNWSLRKGKQQKRVATERTGFVDPSTADPNLVNSPALRCHPQVCHESPLEPVTSTSPHCHFQYFLFVCLISLNKLKVNMSFVIKSIKSHASTGE